MSDLLIFDTSVLIDALRCGRHQQRIANVAGLIRNSSVVLAELWRGAGTPAEKRIVQALEKNHPILTPTTENWLRSGHLLEVMRARRGFGAEKLRDLHFDVLIALTARSYGARLVTSNRADFEVIHEFQKFNYEVW
jgi:predicted nucleic acid-binding protein